MVESAVAEMPISFKQRSLTDAPLYNGNIWLYLLVKAECLSRSQVRAIMEGYKLDQPDSVQELMQRGGVDLNLNEDELWKIFTFNYQNYQDKIYHDNGSSVFRAAMRDLYSISGFGTARSILKRIPVDSASPYRFDYEEYFYPTYVGKEVADITSRLVLRGIKSLKDQGLETFRIIPGDDPLKCATALTKPIPGAIRVRGVIDRLSRVLSGI